MFETLKPVPADPILALIGMYAQDPNPDKVDLGVGVYREADGSTPVLASVKQAERDYLARQTTKSYVGPAGDPDFNAGVQMLLLGADHDAVAANRVRTIQATGGCGALRVAAEMVMRCGASRRMWVSDPTWANHVPLLGSAGLQLHEYPYYDAAANELCFDAMVEALDGAGAGDLVLLHGCCHNPCGEDLQPAQWQTLADVMSERRLVPFIDIAYQGLGQGVDEDAYGVRLMASRVPELIVVSSCAKNFGLYRERAGAICIVAADETQADIVHGQLQNVARGIYSMPPAHGASIVGTILQSDERRGLWLDELTAMRDRLNGMRKALADKLSTPARDFGFIARQRGMFSFLGITADQVARLRDEFSIYMVGTSRINVAGLNKANLDYVVRSIHAVLQ